MANDTIVAVLYEEIVYGLPELTLIEMMVLCKIIYLDNAKHCFAGNEYFAKLFHVSEGTITNTISKLIVLGHVVKEGFDGRLRRLSSPLTQSIKR